MREHADELDERSIGLRDLDGGWIIAIDSWTQPD
jgi:hypothetical protein